MNILEKIKIHKNVFNNKLAYIPFCVKVAQSTKPPHSVLEAMLHPEKSIEAALAHYENTNKVESDIIPIVENNFLEVLVPSIFGAEIHEAPGGLVDVKPVFKDIKETENINIEDIFVGQMENAIKHINYLKANVPDGFYVSPSRPLSPLDCAVVLRGGNFYMELLTEPELSLNFMNKIADVTIKVIKELKRQINQPLDECATPRGLVYPGIRITGDAIVNLSPNMIVEYMSPIFKRFQKEFGKVMLHYCTLPAPSTHVIKGLLSGGGVDCVDNWQGYKTLLNKEDYSQDKIGICTDFKFQSIINGDFKKEEILNTKNRPLTVSTFCETVDDGKAAVEIFRMCE